MLAYRAIYITDDDSPEGWLPYERSVVSWQTVLGDPEAEFDVFREPREAAMVMTGDIGDDRLVSAASIAGFVAIVDPETPVHEVVHLCRQFIMDLLDESEEAEEKDEKDPKAHGPN